MHWYIDVFSRLHIYDEELVVIYSWIYCDRGYQIYTYVPNYPVATCDCVQFYNPVLPGFTEVGASNITDPQFQNCLHRSLGAMQVTISMDTTPPLPIGAPARARISVAVDPVALITTECISVTSAMRKHARWAQSSVAAILGGTSSGYGSVQAAIPPPSPRSSVLPRGGKGVKAEGKEGETRIEVPGLDVGLTNRWGLRGKRGKSIQVRTDGLS